jgi:hypothetical protein
MLALIKAFLNIALRRLGPEHLPDSGLLLALSAAAYGVMQVILGLPYFAGFTVPLLRSVGLDLLLLGGCLWGLLRFTGYPDRYRRTLTALLGTGALLSVVIWPFTLIGIGDPGSGAETLATAGIVGVVLWSLAVNAHILARALSVPFIMGLVAAVAYFLLNYMVVVQLSPASA